MVRYPHALVALGGGYGRRVTVLFRKKQHWHLVMKNRLLRLCWRSGKLDPATARNQL
jgi:hypothetical protein